VHLWHVSVVLDVIITHQRPCPCSTVFVIWSLTDLFLDSLWRNVTRLGFSISDLLLWLELSVLISVSRFLPVISVWLVLGSYFWRSCWEDSLKWTRWFLHCSRQQWRSLHFLTNIQTEWLYSSRPDWAWSGFVKL